MRGACIPARDGQRQLWTHRTCRNALFRASVAQRGEYQTVERGVAMTLDCMLCIRHAAGTSTWRPSSELAPRGGDVAPHRKHVGAPRNATASGAPTRTSYHVLGDAGVLVKSVLGSALVHSNKWPGLCNARVTLRSCKARVTLSSCNARSCNARVTLGPRSCKARVTLRPCNARVTL